MEDKDNTIELLLERAANYGKTSYELIKLKTLHKTSGLISLLIPNTIIIILIASFILFISLGMAFWIGDTLGKVYYGFGAIGALYAVLVIVLRFILYGWIRRMIENYLIKKILK